MEASLPTLSPASAPSPAPRRIHLGVFEGEELRRAGGFSAPRLQEDRLDRDIAAAVAIAAFVASVAVVIASILNVGVPV